MRNFRISSFYLVGDAIVTLYQREVRGIFYRNCDVFDKNLEGISVGIGEVVVALLYKYV